MGNFLGAKDSNRFNMTLLLGVLRLEKLPLSF